MRCSAVVSCQGGYALAGADAKGVSLVAGIIFILTVACNHDCLLAFRHVTAPEVNCKGVAVRVIACVRLEPRLYSCQPASDVPVAAVEDPAFAVKHDRLPLAALPDAGGQLREPVVEQPWDQ